MRSRVAFVVFLMMCFFRQSSFCDTWPLVLTGQIAPGTGEARFASLSQAAVNSRGDIAFHAGVVGGATASSGYPQGCFQRSLSLASPHLMLRAGYCRVLAMRK